MNNGVYFAIDNWQIRFMISHVIRYSAIEPLKI
jgi:hypothetical protein